MGKTSFSMNIGEHVAIEQGLPVAVFSMEMGAVQLAMRMLGSVGLLDQHRMRTGKLIAEDWPRVTHAVQLMQDAQVYIDESPALSPMEVRARAAPGAPVRPARSDHHRLPAADVGQRFGREPGHRSVGNQPFAQGPGQELNCPLIALSQLNRSLEQRPNKRPVMSDLRESGAIEQDADVILFIYRDEVYNPDSPDKGTAEIIIGKQRNGPIGTVRLTFQGSSTRFLNFSGAQPKDMY